MDTEPITFGTDGWRARLGVFTDERVRAVTQAVADVLNGAASTPGPDDGRLVVVGYDARESSEGFATSVGEVLAGAGFDVRLASRDCPTPLVAWAIRAFDARGGVVITASHNPPEYNGVKFIPGDAAPALPAVTDQIEANLRAPDPAFTPTDPGYGTVERADFQPPHAAHAKRLVARRCDPTTDDSTVDLSGLTVAYDAMHGSGRGVTDDLLAAAGADVQRLRCERDPEFGGSPPEPSPEHLTELTRRVTDGEADLGVANDGDADRLAVVTPERGVLDANLLLAATYDALLETADGPAVRTVSTTFLIDRIAAAHDTRAVETAVGFKWVAAGMADCDALLGGEESGGLSVRGHVREKDGVLGALLAAAIHHERSYDRRVDRLTEEYGPIVADKLSVDCPDEAKRPVLDALEAALPEEIAGRTIEEISTVDGFKLLLDDGTWLLVRPSGTEPKMRVYTEADTDAAASELLAAGRELVTPVVERHT